MRNNELSVRVLGVAFAAVLMVTAFATSVSAATFTVNTTADTQDAVAGNGVCADSGGACSLRAAITEANALAGADIINVPAGTFTHALGAANEDANGGGDFDITSPVTINGAGAASTIIQANALINTANERVFHILAGGTAVTISGVTIQNGVFRFVGATPNPQGGGGIRVEGATASLTLSNSTITGNRSENRGGGVTTNKANLSISNCVFNNNQAGSSVAASSASGGAIAVDSEDNVAVAGQTAAITDTIINNNRSESSVSNTFGGGIAVRALNATVTVTGCTISNNTSNALGGFNGYAGGIHNQQATLTLSNSTVFANTSSRYHAGVRNLSSTLAVSTLNIVNTTVNNNTSSAADAVGGGVANIVGVNFDATVNVTSSTISGNNLPGATSVGGGLVNVGATGAALLNVLNSTISGNSANDAAGIYTDGSTAVTSLDFCTVSSNSAAVEGGGLYQDVTGTTTIRNSIIANNTAPTAPDIDGTINSQNYNHVENTAGGVFITAANDVTGNDPQIGTLANNGGPTLTHLPGGTSPVLNTIPIGTNGCAVPVVTDQRGLPRPSGSGCEKGSVEVQVGSTPTATNTGTPTATNTNTPTATNTNTPTATSTSTSTNTATPTFTPTNTPSNTPTSTSTSTPVGSTPTATNTSTATNTPTPGETPSISGTVLYGNAIGNPVPPRPVKNVLVSSSLGTPPVGPVGTGLDGTYTLTGFGPGPYTIQLSKAGGPNAAISSLDAARIAQGVAGVVPFISANQSYSADASGNGSVTSNDAAFVARFAAGLAGFGNTGQWQFFCPPGANWPPPQPPQPCSSYASVPGPITGQDYIGLLVGDASGNYNTATNPRPAGGPERGASVELPNITAGMDKDIVIPVTIHGAAGKEVLSYEFDLRYDPAVIQPLGESVDVKETASRGFSVVTNPYEPGLLRVVVYGAMPIDTNVVLLNLRFAAVGTAGAVSMIAFDRIMLNEGYPSVLATEGYVELSATSDQIIRQDSSN